MLDEIRVSDLTKEEIEALHVRAKNRAYSYFNDMCVMGEDDEILSIMQSIDKEIEEEYLNFLRMAVERNLMYRINQCITYVLAYLANLMSMDFREMGLRVFLPLMIVFRYVFGLFLPSGLYEVFDWIVGNVIWIMIGMFILQVSGNREEVESYDIEMGRTRRKNRPRKRA